MFIRRLLVEGVRNLEPFSLSGFSLINCLVGENGSGKTSFLETISLLSSGKSFRNPRIESIIQFNKRELQIFAECIDQADSVHRLGIMRDKENGYAIRINGEKVNQLAQLSATLPCVVFDASAFDLLDGPPSLRCKFIDWLVFHVEHSFYEHWRRFNRLLKQRNNLLKNRNVSYADLAPWDEEFAILSVAIEKLRCRGLIRLQKVFTKVYADLAGEPLAIQIAYKNGWPSQKLDFVLLDEGNLAISEASVKQYLQESFERDAKYQRTHIGPHRADLQIRINGIDVKEILSRGQKKTLITALKLAQAKMVADTHMNKPILLLDDLPSELDFKHLQRFLNFIENNQMQSFISSVDTSIIELFSSNTQANISMFHVEHGKISQLMASEIGD